MSTAPGRRPKGRRGPKRRPNRATRADESWDLTRLFPGDLIAVLAALLLVFVLAADWYSNQLGDNARQIQQMVETEGERQGEIGRALEERAVPFAEDQEKNAWQANGALDRAILLVSMLAIALALIAAAMRAAGRRTRPPFTPSALLAAVALVGVGLLLARAIDQPGLDSATTIRSGLPFAAVCFGLLMFGAGRAMRREARDTAVAGGPAAGPPPPGSAEPRGDAAA